MGSRSVNKPPPAHVCYITLSEGRLHTHACCKHDPDKIANMQSHNICAQSVKQIRDYVFK